MTYSSCWIEIIEFSPDGFGKTLSKRTEMLWRANSMYWLPTLKKWATARDFEIDYIDNCWIRVNVERWALEEFLREEVQDSEKVIPKIGPVGAFRYVLVAEEF
jgi:hypothetical protein